MYKLLILFLFSVPLSTVAQISDASAFSSSASSASDTTAAPSQTTPASQGTMRREAPVGSVAMHYNYMFQTSPFVGNRSLMGWSVIPQVNFTRHLGFQADFTSLYMRGVVIGESRFLIAAGPRFTFAPRSHFTPWVYGEGGQMRTTTKANHIRDWNPVVRTGIGFDLKSRHGIGFQIIPAEYIGEKVEWRNQWNHSFSARAGIVFNLYK
jgi:hypothetical protein